MARKADLRRHLDELLRAAERGQLPSLELAHSLEPEVLRCSQGSQHALLPRRLARLMSMIGDSDAASRLYAAACTIDPLDVWAAIGYSQAVERTEGAQTAMQIIAPFLKLEGVSAPVLVRGARLASKIGQQPEALDLYRRAVEQDCEQLSEFLQWLTSTGCTEEAIGRARAAIKWKSLTPQVCFRCYLTLRRFASDAAEVESARNRLVDVATRAGEGPIWSARVAIHEGRFESALEQLSDAIALNPGSPELLVERGAAAIAHGDWGRHAAAILGAVPHLQTRPDLKARIQEADLLFHHFGSSLSLAADDPDGHAHIRTPESVFEIVSQTAHPARLDRNEARTGLIMIAASLAAGGAERIVANCFRRFRDDPRLGGAKLYLFDLNAEKGKDFYLPLVGAGQADLFLLERTCVPELPLAWLPPDKARIAQSILSQLIKDRPAIVHASLEPLNVIAALASLIAGVPKIVLHTHNMRPTEISQEDPFIARLKDCYRALLRRPEVTLVACADACVADYKDWLGPDRADNICRVYNGLEFLDEADDVSRSDLRREAGIPLDAPVVGSAFRFAEVKQPLVWIDAAAIVARQLPNCKFVLFGDGELRASIEQYIKSLGLSDHFVLPGMVKDLAQRLALLDLFVLSSRTEALPNVLIEAQAAGVPVISFDVGGVGETMQDGRTGFLVKERSAQALAHAILRALNDPTWRQSASFLGRTFVRERFSMDAVVENLAKVMLRQSQTKVIDAAAA